MNTEAIGIEPKFGLVLQEEKTKKQLRQEKLKLAKEEKLKLKKDSEAKGNQIEQLLMAAVSKLNIKPEPKPKAKPKRLTDESYKKCVEQRLCVKLQLGKCANKDCTIGKHEKSRLEVRFSCSDSQVGISWTKGRQREEAQGRDSPRARHFANSSSKAAARKEMVASTVIRRRSCLVVLVSSLE